ncbi:hypothetical protein ACLKA6_000714 [Drosophila palustris]
METKGKEICVEVRKLILKFRLEGKSWREIGRLVDRSHSSCQRVYENYISTGSILSKPRSGRPSVLTEWEKKRVVQLVPPNPRITAHQGRLEVAEQFKKTISDQTVRRIWKKADYNEHLWDLLERRIRQHTITSKKMLKDVIMEEWSKITAEDTRKLVDSMPRRLAEVLKRKGYPTKY